MENNQNEMKVREKEITFIYVKLSNITFSGL